MGQVFHTIEPVFDKNSRALILGTMPSPKSREEGFYYAHPQNRFWPVLAAVFNERTPIGTEERKSFAKKHGIALWDVLASCDIEGAADSSIKNPVPNDIARLISETEIKSIFTTGGTAYRLYNRYCADKTGIKAVGLSSTSAANARMKLDELVREYRVIYDAVNRQGGLSVEE